MENEYEENKAFLMEGIMNQVRFGFTDPETIIADVCEQVEDEGWENDFDEDWIAAQVQEQYEQRLAASKSWQPLTDTHRLAQAFQVMRKEGIVALHFAGYTQSDSMADVAELYEQLQDSDKQAIGHCFYHEQDLERVTGDEGGTLLLGFYSADAKDHEAAANIARKIICILEGQGFVVGWENDLAQRITIKNFKWLKVYTSEEERDQWRHEQVLKNW